MKTLYIECNMGAAGDMLAGALLELHPDREGFLGRLNAAGLPGVRVAAESSVKCGITGTHITVAVHGEEEHSHDVHPGHVHEHCQEHDRQSHDHGHSHSHHEHTHHHHSGMHDIGHIVSHLNIPERVREDVLAVYRLIAQAESHAHGVPVEQIHFHEVGAMDAVADITAVCMLMHELAPEDIVCSPVHVGSGQVRCAHGILPVPAPATAHILQDVPTYGGEIPGELCTPTGAALLKHFACRFGSGPVMKIEKIGYGMGTKDFPAMNGVRAMLGTTQESTGQIAELRCNLDDMTAEGIAFAAEQLLEAGALDTFTVPIVMKKGRPGAMLSCLCRLEDREKMARLMFAHTTTLGVRESLCDRYTLVRESTTIETEFGPIHMKSAKGWGVERKKAEYDDLARIAREKGISLDQVRGLAEGPK